MGGGGRAEGGVAQRELRVTHSPREKLASGPAIFFRPGHADPALGADAAAEREMMRVAMVRPVGIECAGGNLLRNERSHLRPQRLARGWQAYLIETEFRGHGSTSFL